MIATHSLYEMGLTKTGRFIPNSKSLASRRKKTIGVKDPDQLQTRHKNFKISKFIPTKSPKVGRRNINMFKSGRTNLPSYR